MTYRWVDHTAELGLELEAEREEDVFGEAAAAFGELVAEDASGPPTLHAITLEAPSCADLLVAFLEELVYLAETQQFVPERVTDVVLRGDTLRAIVTGRRGEPRQLVKAVTYHGLEFEHEQDRWRARVVLDV